MVGLGLAAVTAVAASRSSSSSCSRYCLGLRTASTQLLALPRLRAEANKPALSCVSERVSEWPVIVLRRPHVGLLLVRPPSCCSLTAQHAPHSCHTRAWMCWSCCHNCCCMRDIQAVADRLQPHKPFPLLSCTSFVPPLVFKACGHPSASGSASVLIPYFCAFAGVYVCTSACRCVPDDRVVANAGPAGQLHHACTL